MFVIIGSVKVISEAVVTILFRPAQLRNAIGIVILTFPFSRISTLFIFEFLYQRFYSTGFKFQFQLILPNDSLFNKQKQKPVILPRSYLIPEFLPKTFDNFHVELAKERRLQDALLSIKKQFGKNSILKAMNLQEGATAKDRSQQVGGHKA